MNLDLSTLPIPLVPYQLPNGMTIYVPSAHATGTVGSPSAGIPAGTDQIAGALASLLTKAAGTGNALAGTPPDLSALLPLLAPMVSAAVPGIGPFIPIIGALLHILYALTTQVHAATASGTPNPSLQMVHDAAWQQVLGAFGQKAPTPTTAPVA